jgi:hypothetical protein
LRQLAIPGIYDPLSLLISAATRICLRIESFI